jgi:hypothetical protein
MAIGSAKTLVGAQKGLTMSRQRTTQSCHQGFGPAGDEGVVMHAGAIDGEPPFAAERIIHGPLQGAADGEDADDEFGQTHG